MLTRSMQMYHSVEDWQRKKQFVWLSSQGCNTHTHFDQDYNVFVQLVGRKRFTLFPPAMSPYMHIYPRVHPLWHKSQMDFDNPDLTLFPDYVKAEAFEGEVGPGDILFIPPYYWHNVETLTTPSISLSTMSNEKTILEVMDVSSCSSAIAATLLAVENRHEGESRSGDPPYLTTAWRMQLFAAASQAIYKLDHKFDLLGSARGKMFALRLYLDMIIPDMYGEHPRATRRHLDRLVSTRFRGMGNHFVDTPSICNAEVPNKIPTARHVVRVCLGRPAAASNRPGPYFTFPLTLSIGGGRLVTAPLTQD